ncbi:hypothetical protein Pcinc_018164 [Petrolisthes cinctipes]|uniref:Uncharacterized protein n=1 Tax=Petrolisthes cinctipes TaxID=88211 RepID=A0AAE1FMM1_PETCI|nr:hypothetical protein Pcinc_018164 [Petrolisthes cinctipes]
MSQPLTGLVGSCPLAHNGPGSRVKARGKKKNVWQGSFSLDGAMCVVPGLVGFSYPRTTFSRLASPLHPTVSRAHLIPASL